MGDGFYLRLPYIVLALLVFFAFYFAAKGVRALIRNVAQRRKRHRNIGLLMGRLAQAVMVFLGLLISLVIALPTFKPAQLVDFLGITSVAIGFAFRDILQNFLAGILILWNQPFEIGDQIKMGDFEGNVESIQTRATMIRTYDGRRVVIPNSQLFSNPVIVNTAYPSRRMQYDIGIGYGDDIAKAKEIIMNVMRNAPEVLDDPAPEVLVTELAGSSVNLRARWWINPPKRSEVVHSVDLVLEAAKKALVENGIDLPFPTQQVLFHDQTEDSDGDRTTQREGWPARKGKSPRSRSIADGITRRERPSDSALEI